MTLITGKCDSGNPPLLLVRFATSFLNDQTQVNPVGRSELPVNAVLIFADGNCDFTQRFIIFGRRFANTEQDTTNRGHRFHTE